MGEATPQHNGEKSLAGMKERLSARGVVFAPSQYKREQEAGTQRAMVESGRALQYLALLKHGGGDTPAGERKRRTYDAEVIHAAGGRGSVEGGEDQMVRAGWGESSQPTARRDRSYRGSGGGDGDRAAEGMAKEATAA